MRIYSILIHLFNRLLPTFALIFVEQVLFFAQPSQSILAWADTFPTRVFSTHSTSFDTAEKQHYNIGVIQVRLKHWTTTTTTTPKPVIEIKKSRESNFEASSVQHSPPIYPPFNRGPYYDAKSSPNRSLHVRHSKGASLDSPLFSQEVQQHQHLRKGDNIRSLKHKNIRKNITVTLMGKVGVDHGDTFTEIILALWKRLDLFNSPLGYMIIAATFMLVALLAVIYAVLTVTLSKRRQKQREKYNGVRLVVADNVAEIDEFGQGRRYRQFHPNPHRHPSLQYEFTSSRRSTGGSRSQTPKNSLSSLQRHYVDQRQHSELQQMSETELERLYRSISPFRRYPPGTAPTITPSITSEESATMMRRVGTGNNDWNRRIKDKKRRPPLEAPPPPPPPRIPPPPIPPHYISRKQTSSSQGSGRKESRIESEIRLQRLR